MTITGTDFRSGATVRFGNLAAANVTIVTATEIRATTPASSPGASDIEVRNPDGGVARLAGGFTFVEAAPSQQVYCSETFESVNLDITSLSDDHFYDVNGCGLRGRVTTNSKVYMESVNPISGSRSLVLDNAAGLWANHLQYAPTLEQLRQGIYFAWTTRFERNLGVGAKLHRWQGGGRWLQIGADMSTDGSGRRAEIQAELDNVPSCPSPEEIVSLTGGCAGATGIHMTPGTILRWMVFYQKQAGGRGVIKWWANRKLIAHLEGGAIGSADLENAVGIQMGWSFVTNPWNGEWGAAELGSTLLIDDVVIANFNPDEGQSSAQSAARVSGTAILEDNFESGDWARWNRSHLHLSAERAAAGRSSARADHLAGSLGSDVAEAHFGDFLGQQPPVEDIRVEFDVFLEGDANVHRSDSGAACGTALARLLASDDGRALHAEPFPAAPYLVTLCLDERLEPRFELLRRTGSGPAQVFRMNRIPFRLLAGQWHNVVFRARLNSPGRADGVLELWIDGQQAMRYEDVNFRDDTARRGWNLFQLTGEDTAPPARSWRQYWDNVRLVALD